MATLANISSSLRDGANKPVFSDVSGRRWSGFVTFWGSALATIFVLLGAFVISAFITPNLALNAQYNAKLEHPSPIELAPAVPRVQKSPESKIAPEIFQVAKTNQTLPSVESQSEVEIAPVPPQRPVVMSKNADPSKFPSITWLEKPEFSPAAQLKKAGLEERLPDFFPPERSNALIKNNLIERISDASVYILNNLFISSASAHESHDQNEPIVIGVIDSWDPQGVASLYANRSKIDVLMPKWLSFNQYDKGISVSVHNADDIRKTGVKIAPIFEISAHDSNQVKAFLGTASSNSKRKKLVEQLVDFAHTSQSKGITLDIKHQELMDSPHFGEFTRELKESLNNQGLKLFQILPVSLKPNSPAATLGNVDLTIFDLSFEHAWGDKMGPIGSIDWYKHEIATIAKTTDLSDVALIVRNTAMDWDDRDGATQLSLPEAYRLARKHAATIEVDVISKNSFFKYQDSEGQTHTVWLFDAVSLLHQLQTLKINMPKALAIADLGEEDASIWPLIANPSHASINQILEIDTSKQIHYFGEGELFSVSREPQLGKREVVTSELTTEPDQIRMTQIPNGFEVQLSGASQNKQIALTFDDGPDPTFTPAILDILAEHNVSATFFALGEAMVRHPELVARMLSEGHVVGSHTFSHINIASIDSQILDLELNSTQSVFKSISGRNMALFRAPFSVDAWPISTEEIMPLAAISKKGYLSVGAKIDPRDWSNTPASEITRHTVSSAVEQAGQIVMLHDGGGDRSRTVTALPAIIEELRAKGYTFVSLSDFSGMGVDKLMPESTDTNIVSAAFVAGGIQLLKWGQIVLSFFFVAAIVLGSVRAIIMIMLSFQKRKNKVEWVYDPDATIGVVVPAYNESKVILKTVNSVLKSSHKNLKVLVVDDGSDDDTFRICVDAYCSDPRVEVVTQRNAGKSAALNHGFSLLDTEIIVALDADTVFDEQTIPLLAGHFENPKIAAVAGNAKVGNRRNLLTKWQALEYITAQNLDRRAFAFLNCITVVPGAVGAWRREAVLSLGGFGSDTLAEDADLTVRLLREGYEVAYEEFAIAYTEAPEKTKDFARQRLRWMFGMMQVGFKNLSAMQLRDGKSVGLVAIPNILIFQVLFPIIAPIADLVAILTLFDLGIHMTSNSELIGLNDALQFIVLFGVFIILDLFSAAIAFWHERDEKKRLLCWLLPQRFYYRQLLYIAAIQALLSAIRGEGMNWGHLNRLGTVPTQGTLKQA